MPYTHFVAIGYRTITQKPFILPEVKGTTQDIYTKSQEIVDYSQVTKLENEEAKQQLKYLGMVFYKAYSHVQQAPSFQKPTTLKIFIAPEFLFRPAAANAQGELA